MRDYQIDRHVMCIQCASRSNSSSSSSSSSRATRQNTLCRLDGGPLDREDLHLERRVVLGPAKAAVSIRGRVVWHVVFAWIEQPATATAGPAPRAEPFGPVDLQRRIWRRSVVGAWARRIDHVASAHDEVGQLLRDLDVRRDRNGVVENFRGHPRSGVGLDAARKRGWCCGLTRRIRRKYARLLGAPAERATR
jgi:muconolactone delta-isomerase